MVPRSCVYAVHYGFHARPPVQQQSVRLERRVRSVLRTDGALARNRTSLHHLWFLSRDLTDGLHGYVPLVGTANYHVLEDCKHPYNFSPGVLRPFDFLRTPWLSCRLFP